MSSRRSGSASRIGSSASAFNAQSRITVRCRCAAVAGRRLPVARARGRQEHRFLQDRLRTSSSREGVTRPRGRRPEPGSGVCALDLVAVGVAQSMANQRDCEVRMSVHTSCRGTLFASSKYFRRRGQLPFLVGRACGAIRTVLGRAGAA
jgi:hypothetical protein